MEFTQARIRLELGLLNMQLTKIAIVLLKMKRLKSLFWKNNSYQNKLDLKYSFL